MGYGLAVATVLASARSARAGAETSIVVIESEAATDGEAETVDAIRAQVGDLPVSVVIEQHARLADLRAQIDYAGRVAKAHDARGVFWVDADVSGDTLLFMFDPDEQRLLLRRIHHEGNREAATEEVADVAHGIIEALAEGRHVGMTAVPTERARADAAPHVEPRHVAMSAPPPRASVAFGAGVAAESWTSHAWSAGAAVFGEASLFGGAFLRAEYTFFEPFTARGAGTTIRLARHPVDIAAGWEARSGHFALGAELGATLDPVGRSTLSVAGGGGATPDRVAWTFAVSPRVRVSWEVLPWLALYGRAGADVFLAQTSYAVGDAAVFSPDVARLRVDLGVSFIAWGRR